MQENPDEKLIDTPHEQMLPTPEMEIPASTTPDAVETTPPQASAVHSTHSNTGIIIIVVLLLINLILGVYVFFQFQSYRMANSFIPKISASVETSNR